MIEGGLMQSRVLECRCKYVSGVNTDRLPTRWSRRKLGALTRRYYYYKYMYSCCPEMNYLIDRGHR